MLLVPYFWILALRSYLPITKLPDNEFQLMVLGDILKHVEQLIEQYKFFLVVICFRQSLALCLLIQ